MYEPLQRPGRQDPAPAAIATLHVDVIADLVCPWCYIGKRRLDRALRAVYGPVEVDWIPFQLNPGMPAGGMAIGEYLDSRFASRGEVDAALASLTEAGRDEGIEFDFDAIIRVPNTLDGHRLMYLAGLRGVDTGAVAESLMQRFLTRGEDISDPGVLVAVGTAHGLDAEDVIRTLEDDHSANVVREQEAQLRKSGVAGAPAFLVNRRLFVSGAQDDELLVGVFDRAMFGDADDDQPAAPLH